MGLRGRSAGVISRDYRGSAVIEFGIIAPILILLILGVIEFGYYYVKEQIVSRAVTNLSIAIQTNPDDPNLQSLANSSGLNMINFQDSPNYFCAKSYSTRAQADALCASGWDSNTPLGHTAGTPYYVAIVAAVDYSPITPVGGKYLPDILMKNIVMVGGVAMQAHGVKLISTHATPPSPFNGSWVVPTNVTSVKITMLNGGDGGNGAKQNATNIGSEDAGGGKGGNSGAAMIAVLSNLTPGTSLSYSLGAGGLGATTSTGFGAGGGTTVFNSLNAPSPASAIDISPTYGTLSSYALLSFNNGTGATLQDYNTGCGTCVSYQMVGGNGGDSPLGLGSGGNRKMWDTANDEHLPGNGGGGVGGWYNNGTVVQAGNGGSGLILIEW